ncbi:MAG TPA: polyprenol monophosphomannose synthase, partial [Bacteroidetes bacterium]|nr:polyprenol monophosphomannose synthase [Bacteroidota bacterium]
ASKYVRIITGLPIHDTTAGFVCYGRKALDTLDLKKIKFHGYAFQIEMKFSIWKLGFNLKEVPIIFRDRVKGSSKLNSGIIQEAAFGVIFLKLKSFFSTYAKSK